MNHLGRQIKRHGDIQEDLQNMCVKIAGSLLALKEAQSIVKYQGELDKQDQPAKEQ